MMKKYLLPGAKSSIILVFGLWSLVFGLFPFPSHAAMSGGGYTIPSLTISGGGAANSSGGGYSLQVMTGQTVIGLSSGSGYNAQLGGIYALSGTGESMIAGGRLEIATERLPNGQVGVPYITTLEARNGTPRYAWSAPGGLPPGLTLNARGTLEGIPTAPGIYDVRIRVEDSDAAASEESFTVSILNAGVAGPQLRLTALLQGYYNSATNTSRLAVISVEAWTGAMSDAGVLTLEELRGIATINMNESGVGTNGFMRPGGVNPATDYIADGRYYLVVKHKLPGFPAGPNHAPVVTRSTVSLEDRTTTDLNVTVADSPLYIRSAGDRVYDPTRFDVGSGRWVLKGGFLDNNDDIGLGDYNILGNPDNWQQLVDDGADVRADIDGDRAVGLSDYNILGNPANWQTRTSVPAAGLER